MRNVSKKSLIVLLLLVMCMAGTTLAAPDGGAYETAILGLNPAFYTEHDEPAHGNPVETTGGWAVWPAGGSASNYNDQTDLAPALTGSANTSVFIRQTTDASGFAPDGGVPAPNSKYWSTASCCGGNPVLGPNEALPTGVFSAVMFIQQAQTGTQTALNPVFVGHHFDYPGTANGSIDLTGIQPAGGAGVPGVGWALYAKDTNGLPETGSDLTFEFTDGVSNNVVWTTGVDVLDGQAHMIGVSYDGAGNAMVYHNGVLVSGAPTVVAGSLAGIVDPSPGGFTRTGIGNFYGGDNIFHGLIDELAIFVGSGNLLSAQDHADLYAISQIPEPAVFVAPLSLAVDEAGETTDTYTVVLGAAPLADVTVTAVPASSDVTLDVGGGPLSQVDLTFTSINWLTPQTVTVKAVDDVLKEGDETFVITHSAVSADANYNGIAIDSVTVDVADNDVAGWVPVGGMSLDYEWNMAPDPPGVFSWPWGDNNINPDPALISYGGFWTGGSFDWLWDGLRYVILSVDNSIDSYDAYITQTIPLAGLLDTVHGGSYGPGLLGQQFLHHADPGIGTGQTGIWVELSYGTGEVDSVSQNSSSAWQWTTVNVDPATALTELTIKIGILKNPAVNTGTRSLVLEDFLLWAWSLPLLTPVGDYAQWENFNFDLEAQWQENIFGLKLSSSQLEVSEAGPTSTTYQIFGLDEAYYDHSAPTSNVIVTITPDSQTTVNPTNLTFTPANYSTPRTVTITAIDDGILEGPHTSTITHAFSSSDPYWNEAVIPPLTVKVRDSKEISVTPLALEVAETSETTDTYTIVLSSIPSGDVTVTATRSSEDVTLDIGGGPLAQVDLVFTTTNYATPQTVTVKAVDDALSEGPETVTITHSATSSDSGYNGMSVNSVEVDVIDNEEYCGEPGQIYLELDVAGPGGIGAAYRDCIVNFYDFAAVSTEWMYCTDRFDPECLQWE